MHTFEYDPYLIDHNYLYFYAKDVGDEIIDRLKMTTAFPSEQPKLDYPRIGITLDDVRKDFEKPKW